VSQSDVTPSGLSGPVTARAGDTPSERQAVAGASGWTGGRIAAVVIGALLALVSLGLLGGGGTTLWAYLTHRDGGYVTSGVHTFSTAGSALATKETQLGSSGVGWAYSPSVLGTVRIRVTPHNAQTPLFVGIGRSSEVDRYLTGVEHTVISDFWSDTVEPVAGGQVGSAPAAQDFWVASSTGTGTRTVDWRPANGTWTVVVMNADGRPGVDIGADLGARVPALLWIAVGLLVAGAVFMAGGVLLIVGAFRRRRG